ncbi:alpha-1,3/1,6-mannosyltransferase ALG2 isoform X2 [Athalia rosae]|nr:alpha-1,3/1,6-mannosyltransferase ALG2 isoform X2 [Athalia rosae]
MVYAASYMFFLKDRPDVVFCDLVSVCIPVLRLYIPHVIYYCHHPDQLLSPPGSQWKSLYRVPLNYLEEITTGQADKIFVNSKYTGTVFRNTFTRLQVCPEVLYPSINTEFFDKTRVVSLDRALDKKFPDSTIVFLSINRYERKKNLNLAIEALAELKELLPEKEYEKVHLIMAGGYDKRVEENVEHYLELTGLADELQVADKITFLRSPSDSDKLSILSHCNALIYTPPNEHFGIVPLEAMYMEKLVIANNSGGPTESIIDGVSGFLVDLSAKAFAQKMAIVVTDRAIGSRFGKAGKERFVKTFSFAAFANQLEESIQNLMSGKKNN